jgi:hypothetical protein
VKLRYETGTATLVPFLVIMLLGFIGGIAGVVSQCKDNGVASCVQDSVVTFAYILILAGWFGFIAMLGYAAQDQRSHRLAKVLILVEALVLMVALFNAKHHPDVLGLVTSLTDAGLAAWIIVLAFRLNMAKGGRITTAPASKPRRRRTATKR